jgi:poly-gamma-glutamate synthesis protein (capsule biosynthesis protein)
LPLEDLIQKDSRIQLIEDPTNPDIRVEQNADLPLTEWIYAFVAPFPTVQDGGSLDGLRQVWRTIGGSWVRIFASPSTTLAMEGILGPPSDEETLIVHEDDLLDSTWSTRPAFAIVPFEALEPQWKVLEIDGSSPIRKDFAPSSYPLVVRFGLSGDPSKVDILQEALNWPSTNRDPHRMTVLVMTGTTALVRATAWTMEKKGITFPGELIGHWMSEADLSHISNEVSLSQDCPKPDPNQSDLIFCSDPKYLSLFDEIGVDLIEITGNHVMDWGREAFLYTLGQYQQHEWLFFGGGENLADSLQPLRIEHNGNRLAFLGCNKAGPRYAWATSSTPGAAPCDMDQFFDLLQELRAEGYIPIFTFQWEEKAIPQPDQLSAFRETIEAGAMIVSGSQAHTPQRIEFHEDGFIHYGLGNLFFDQMQSLELRQEFIDRHVFYDGRHISTELLTAMLENYAQPRPMTVDERSSLLEKIFSASGW